MAKETQLVTVPSFMFDNGIEKSIQVNYYNGSIELVQDGDFDTPDRILLDPDAMRRLFKDIVKHLPEAIETLKR